MQRDVALDFTPFGYMRNPAHLARGWGDTQGGNLRTSTDRLGVEWAYPVGRDTTSRAGIAVETALAGKRSRTRAEFDAIGLVCRQHSCLVFGFQWQIDGVHVEVQFFLGDANALCARVLATNRVSAARPVSLVLVAFEEGQAPERHVLLGEPLLEIRLAPGEQRRITVALGRAQTDDAARDVAVRALANVDTTYGRLVEEDARFLAACPTLSGDWPAHWREGLHHDMQTTRMLVQPPGGIFTDVWPAWMTAWPRVVLAEGTLDMLRLAYADAAVAQRAVASLFRDAPAANVPCVFGGGEYNMVAADGSRCGTSPAWCLPFLNLQLLYLRTLDRDWLRAIYPGAAAYVDWWLSHRTSPDGWVVYKCTWESGEDGNTRLDPTGSGDADVADRVAPVELQATLAHAATVLAFFASELGLDDARWGQLAAEYTRRTLGLFDTAQGRYCDWLLAEGRLQTSCPDRPYWDIDACRFSAQSLTPLLLGLPLDPEEVWRHASPPWTLWPSWTWSLVESAAAAGLYAGVGQLAFETIDRVYRVTTRREVGSLSRPMPGCSPEFWPEDWRTYGGSDAYGWGATTANLLLRHLFGFKESLETDGWVVDLTPAFPASMLRSGARYTVRQLSYRGRVFDLTYTVVDDRLRATFDFADGRHELDLRAGERVTVRL